MSLDHGGYPSSPPDPEPRPSFATGVAPPHSLEAEQSVLGGILLSDRVMPALRMQEGLLAEHFYRDRLRAIYAAMLALDDRGDAIDVLTVTVELEQHGKLEEAGGRAAIDELTGGVPGLGGIRRYARIVIEHWQARQTLAATYTIQSGIACGDPETVEEGRRLLEATTVAPGVTDGYLGPDALGSHMLDWMGQPAVEGLPMPVELPSLGRMVRPQPGDLIIVAALPSAGKSTLAIAMAAAFGGRGHRTVIWPNDDTVEDIAARHVQAVTGIPSDRIVERRLSPDEMRRAVAEFARLPFEAQPCNGWTAEQVAAHIMQVRPAVAVLDHFHNLAEIPTVAEIDDALKRLKAVAKQTRCVLIVAAQCNRNNRSDGVFRRPPVLANIRGSVMFEATAETILLAHIDEEEIDDLEHGRTGKARQLDVGSIDVAKQKRGRRGVVRVMVDREHVRFVERARGRDFAEPSPGSVEAEGF